MVCSTTINHTHRRIGHHSLASCGGGVAVRECSMLMDDGGLCCDHYHDQNVRVSTLALTAVMITGARNPQLPGQTCIWNKSAQFCLRNMAEF